MIFGAICLQETWLGEHTDLSLFQIDNYFCMNQFKQCSEHGGLLIYLHNSYDFEIFNTYKSNYWEGLFVKVMNKNSYVYCS